MFNQKYKVYHKLYHHAKESILPQSLYRDPYNLIKKEEKIDQESIC